MSLIKHSTLNLIGNLIPALVFIPAFGYISRVLGLELFGAYTLAIAIVGYAGIFDAGLTRAVVREVALYRSNSNEIKKIIASSSLLITFLGCLALLLMVYSAPAIVTFLRITGDHLTEVKRSIRILAISIPFFLIGQTWLSVLEGKQHFSILNFQRSLGSLFLAGLPVLFLLINPTLVSAMYGLLVARIITFLLSMFCIKKELFSSGFKVDIQTTKRLISFGGWITVSNVISPIMSTFDRFIASSILGAQNIAFYTVPSELINKGLIIPSALSRAIFPKLIAAERTERFKLINIGYMLLIGVCGCGAIMIFFMSGIIMTFWMGESYSGLPVDILKILLVGFFFNSLAQIPFSNIQAYGKSKLTALIH
ncbi:TPA: flippase, partial [Citrobacter sedlakii]